MTTEDMVLVREYAMHGSEEAFATLVSRHVNLVYSVALRQLRNPHLAEEVTQAAFIILARKTGSLGPKTILSAWLCRTAQYAAARALRTQHRRQNREQEAYMQSLLNQPESETPPWLNIAPLLDIAMAGLGEKDHSAIVLRFFEGKDLKEVGAALGVNENAAKTRVSRAVQKLRQFFVGRGVILSTTVLTASISANSVQAAPAALAKSVSALAIAKGSVASGSTFTLIKGALKIMAWTKIKTAITVGAALLLATGTATLVVRQQGSANHRLGSKVKYTSEQASVQDIVQSLAEQAGLRYDWQRSFDQTDPLCRQWVRNVAIEGKTCAQALEQILKPVGLSYQVEHGVLVLSRQPGGPAPAGGSAGEQKPAAADPANPPLERKVKYTSEQASVQDIVQSLVEQAGLRYDWQKSFAQTDPLCRQRVRNVAIEGKTCAQALEQILKPVGLSYQVEDGVLVLSR